MKKLIQLSSLLFYFLVICTSFLSGFIFAGLSGAGKGQGLAGSAIVFMYGVVAAFLAFIVALFVVYYVDRKTIVKINKVLTIVMLIAVLYIAYRFITREGKSTQEIESPSQPTSPAVPVLEVSINPDKPFQQIKQEQQKKSMGLGFFKPNFYENSVIYFYGDINLEKPVSDHSPIDSITFKLNKYGQMEIVTAPPWLVPKHLKLDYDLLYFKCESISYDFVEVVVNETNGQTSHLSKYQGKIIYWPEFLLGMNSIEIPENAGIGLKVRPFNQSGDINTKYEYLQPIQVKDYWMQVLLKDKDQKKLGKAWIQWRDHEKLLVEYSLLS